MDKEYKTKDWLMLYYVEKRLSIREIAKLCGTSANTIKVWLEKHNIARRTLSEAAILRFANGYHPTKGKHSKLRGRKRPRDVCEKISKKNKGKLFSESHRKNISNACKGRIPWNKSLRMVDRSREKNLQWKGDMATASAKHAYVRRNFRKNGVCEMCGERKTTQWSNKTHTYKRLDRSNWQELCISCHSKYDFKTGLRKPTKKKQVRSGSAT